MSPPQAQAGGRGARSGGVSAHSGGEGEGEGGRPRPILRRIARHAAEMRRRMPPLMPRRGRPLHILSISDLVVFSTLIPRRTMYAVMSPLVLNSDLAISTSLSLGGIRSGGGSHPYKMCPGWAGPIRHSRRGPGPWGGCTLRGRQSQGRTCGLPPPLVRGGLLGAAEAQAASSPERYAHAAAGCRRGARHRARERRARPPVPARGKWMQEREALCARRGRVRICPRHTGGDAQRNGARCRRAHPARRFVAGGHGGRRRLHAPVRL